MSRLPVRVLTAVVAVLSVFGCSGEIIAPTSRAGASNRSANGNGNPHVPNAVKYSDAGIKPATGRSGTATMDVVALLAKDGTTEVDATAGSIMLGTTVATFRKIQTKLSAAGTPNIRTANYQDLSSGTWSQTYTSLQHKDAVQVQANIRGVDGARMDVVTVSAPVSMRPDLTVQSLRGPAQAQPGQLVHLSATVSEINGDLGARADCVLSVDGAEVDRAAGIWVDANGVVSCTFAHTFKNAGTYSVQVAATNVSPADWDMANNAASTTITILDPGAAIATGVLAAEKFDMTWTHSFIRAGGSFGPDTHTEQGHQSSSDIFVMASDPTANPQTQHVDAVITVDGTVTHSVSFNTPSFTTTIDDSGEQCWEYDSDGEWLSACSFPIGGGASETDYYYEMQAGSVTYTGSEHFCSALGVCGVWETNVAQTTGSGVAFNIGSTLQVHLSFVDVNGLEHTIDQTVHPVLQPATAWPNFVVHVCGSDEFQGNYCTDNVNAGTDYRAQVSWP
jgi:hypothetical protein